MNKNNSWAQYGSPSTNSSSFEEYLHVLVPTKTYSKQSQTSVTEETNQIHSETSLPSFISPDMFVLAETSAFSKEDAAFPFVSAIESASGEELGSVKLYFVVGGTDSNWGNMQQMVKNQLILLFRG